MISWDGYIVELQEAIEFRDMGKSPLKYERTGGVKRLVLCDTSVTDPPNKGDTYFAEIERWRRWSSRTRKRLKKPKLEEIIPGVGDNCIVAFLDWHDYGKNGYYIDYVKSRQDKRGKSYARRVIEEFYKRHPKAKTIHYGKMMREEIHHILRQMQEKFPKVDSMGSVYY